MQTPVCLWIFPGGRWKVFLQVRMSSPRPVSIFQHRDYESETLSQPDPAKLSAAVNALSCVTNPSPTETKDATYAYEGGKYFVKEEIYGTRVTAEKLYDCVDEAMENLPVSQSTLTETVSTLSRPGPKTLLSLRPLWTSLIKRCPWRYPMIPGIPLTPTMVGFFSVGDDLTISSQSRGRH